MPKSSQHQKTECAEGGLPHNTRYYPSGTLLLAVFTLSRRPFVATPLLGMKQKSPLFLAAKISITTAAQWGIVLT
jgi:hypothetical protein